MITIANIRAANPKHYNEIWAIVRSLKHGSDKLIHVPELSPDWDLFKAYRSMVQSGTWNQDTFNTHYRPRFMDQMNRDPLAQAKLDELIEKDRTGQRIALVCFCGDPATCHRSLIAEILRSRGVEFTLY